MLDEVANGLSFYDYTFLREVPRLHCILEDRLPGSPDGCVRTRLASFLRIGSWIGGDRDGNPARDGRRYARHSPTAGLADTAVIHLDELHELGRELSLAADLTDVSAGTARAGRTNGRHVAASPWRTLPPRGVRHLRAAFRDGHKTARAGHAAPADGAAPPYESVNESSADLWTLPPPLADGEDSA